MDSACRLAGRTGGTPLDQLTGSGPLATMETLSSSTEAARLRSLQILGILCGFSAGAWLGAAEAPTKLVKVGVSPVVVSLLMVMGVFLARWSVPALVRGTAQMYTDMRHAPHLVVWGVLAGCLWAVANTMTIFAIRDIGLSIAFPLWNTNSLIGIIWGFVFFNELRGAGGLRWFGVIGGAVLMFGGAILLALTSATQLSAPNWAHGIFAAVGAGILWGTMYIPYRKAYLTGMNPLSFVAFFTIGELGMMLALALSYSGGPSPLWQELVNAKSVLFWLMLGGFVWVVGDIFQQYAAKYVGISRGIPLSNTNQLWGLLWGILVFGELRGRNSSLYAHVVVGSLAMVGGAAAIALSSVNSGEHVRWQEAATREGDRYAVDQKYLQAGIAGRDADGVRDVRHQRSWRDWVIVTVATSIFIALAVEARIPEMTLNWTAIAALSATMLVLLVACGRALWKITQFN